MNKIQFDAHQHVPHRSRAEAASGFAPCTPPAGGNYLKTLLALSALEATEHKLLRIYLEHARTMCGAKNAGGLRIALAAIRQTARDTMRKAAELEQRHWPTADAQFDADLADIAGGDFDKATLAYGDSQ